MQNHIKNRHKDKAFCCSGCDEKFAFDWQLKYHRKFCGTELKCRTCGKKYSSKNPTSLLMHCKRNLHLLPVEQQFKSVKKSSFASATTVLLVPIFIDRSSPLLNNRPILPKPAQAIHPTASFNLNQQLPSSKKSSSSQSRKAENAHITHTTSRRSTDCQTVRKKNRAHSKLNVQSIQTQTMASSFDVPQSSKTHLAPEGELRAKCSSTQTFLDDFGEQSEPIMRDTFLSTSEESHLETAVQTQYSFGSGIYSDTQTQTQTNMADLGGIDDMNTMADGGDFQIFDLELTDIETQTIWNYDRTTQTDMTISLDADWLNI